VSSPEGALHAGWLLVSRSITVSPRYVQRTNCGNRDLDKRTQGRNLANTPWNERASSSCRTGGRESSFTEEVWTAFPARDSEIPRGPLADLSRSCLVLQRTPSRLTRGYFEKRPPNAKRGIGNMFVLVCLGQEEIEKRLGNFNETGASQRGYW
jgi:hypothetical protein